ncbi:MAG TPA: peptidase M28, partial [Limnochordia bacterium]
IPFQYDWMPGGGTDAGKIHIFGEGVPTVSIGIPARYIHSHASVIHRDDFENTVRLMLALIERIDEKTATGLRS